MSSGASYYYTALRSYLDAQKVYFEVGGAPGETGRWRKLRHLLVEHRRLHRRLSTERFDLAHLNRSIDPPCVFRDGGLIVIARQHRLSVLVFCRGWAGPAYVRPRPRLFCWVDGRAVASVMLAESFRRALAVLGVRPPTFVATTSPTWQIPGCLAG
jgi:hypothetical protein